MPYLGSLESVPVMRIKGIPPRLLKTIHKPFWVSRPLALALWFGLSLIIALQHAWANAFNNYTIYKNVFFHTIHLQNLYTAYPDQQGDLNHYGPFFSLLIAPFAWLPDKIGVVCWVMANAAFLLYAIRQLPLPAKWKTVLILLCANEMMINSGQVQTNGFICGCILLAFSFTEKQKEPHALFFIVLGTFVKLYAITAIVFFLFSKNKIRFILWGTIWAAVLFLAPMIISNPQFILHSYKDWMASLAEKSIQNAGVDGADQNVSVMGMIRRIFYSDLDDRIVLVPAALIFFSQFLNLSFFSTLRFRYYALSSVLIFTVIFSNSAEASTYIIAVPGMCLWFLLQPRTKANLIFFAIIFFLTTFLYSDIFVSHWMRRQVFKPYSLKAFCPMVLWFVILVQIHSGRIFKLAMESRQSFARLGVYKNAKGKTRNRRYEM